MMLYTKYESSGPCSFRQEDFWKLHFENLLFDPVTYLCNQSEPFEQLGRGPPRDHSCLVWSKSNEWFQRRRCLSKKVYGRRTMHDGQSPVTIAHHEHFVLRWAKNVLLWSCLKRQSHKIHDNGYKHEQNLLFSYFKFFIFVL